MPLMLGLDVGTQGVRAIACDETGNVISQSRCAFPASVVVSGLPTGWFEQHPEGWWHACVTSLRELTSALSVAGRSADEIAAIAVDSTSGTILPVDSCGNSLHPAIMYNDARAVAEARECNENATDLTAKLGYTFNASFGLPKILWLAHNEPDTWNSAEKTIHAADYIVGKLTGDYGKSDNSNALKTGYDLVDERWPDFIAGIMPSGVSKLPDVFHPGEVIGKVSSECAEQTGLLAGTRVVGGVSDGTAGFIASGASRVGEWNSTIGTTFVLRGVSERLIGDPQGRIYCHRHPDGFWLPGGASNVGGECLEKAFAGEDLKKLDELAGCVMPTGLLAYPLARRGERLPFIDPNAEGFMVGEQTDRVHLYAAHLEGVGFVERWCYELMKQLGAEVGDTIYATGGAARSLEWMRIRASILNKRLVRPVVTESAMGAAIVAASRTVYSSLVEACGAMVRYDATVDPDPKLTDAYDKLYAAFRSECAARGLGS